MVNLLILIIKEVFVGSAHSFLYTTKTNVPSISYQANQKNISSD